MSSMDPTGAATQVSSPEDSLLETPIEQAAQASDDPSTAASTDAPTDAPTGQAALPVVPVVPVLPFIKRPVSGRYRSAGAGFQLELRIDVDRARPMRRVSGDFFSVSGATRTYVGSFVVDAPAITVSTTLVTIDGVGKFTWSAAFPKIRVTVPRVTLLQPPAPATLRFFSLANVPGATYLATFESAYFRTVHIETDRVNDVVTPAFSTYNTGSLPSGGPARSLSVVQAFAEAGVQLQVSAASNVVNGGAGANARWSDAELHASMLNHFSLWQEVPQFKVWQLVAQNYDNPSVLGIMFDQAGRHRQGCAVFHGGLGGVTADKLRLQLFAYVHELGHCFNLLHSWQKSLASPPGVNRPASLSWMNYPQMFPGGTAAFWNAFPFQFDDGELVHLRHAFLNNVIMGGNNFAAGAGLEDVQMFNEPLEDRSGLKLEISAPRSFGLGEPVTIDVRLHTTDSRGMYAHPHLNPSAGLVQIAIRKPSGQVVAYEPMIDQCVAPQPVALDTTAPLGESVFVGYGHEGLYFDAPGVYQLRAAYSALDGSQIVSNILQLRVRSPITQADDELADLLLDDNVGALFYLQGSDAEQLRSGRDALDLIIDKHAAHPLSRYARMIKGTNLARDFKTVRTDSDDVHIRQADGSGEAQKLLAGIVETSGDAGMPDRSALTAVMAGLADGPARKGGTKARSLRASKAEPAEAKARIYE
jgi:hypothetical protein